MRKGIEEMGVEEEKSVLEDKGSGEREKDWKIWHDDDDDDVEEEEEEKNMIESNRRRERRKV